MIDFPNIAIGLVTYKRTELALRTIYSTCRNLLYPKEKRWWYIGDDGSPGDHLGRILHTLSVHGENVLGFHSERIRHPGQEETHNAGLGWNRTLGICHQFSDFVLFLEDDWDLDEPLDLKPHIQMLHENERVGICSFRILSTDADVFTQGYNGRMYLQYERRTQYAFSGNPYLRHARYTNKYGWFAEDRNPGLMELDQDDRYRTAQGGDEEYPRIWRPADISVWGAWKHIGTEKSWS